MTPDEAIAGGAMALFGEKYGDTVRVVSMGRDGNRPYSMELCGGTHVRQTGDIGAFRILQETAVGSNTRRIEAITGPAAVTHGQTQERLLTEAAALLKAAPADVPERLQAVLDERRRLEREVSDLRRKLAQGGVGGPNIETVNGVNWVGQVLTDVPAKELKGMIDDLKQRIQSGVVGLIGVDGAKVSLVVGVTPDLTDRFNAVDLVRSGAAVVGGKGGGGRPDLGPGRRTRPIKSG